MSDPSTVDDLETGDHACVTFSDGEERLDIVSAFVQEGLRGQQRVLCLTQALTPDAMTAAMHRRGLPVAAAARRGQLTVLNSGDLFLSDGTFAPQRTLELISAQIDDAERHGYAGLRVASDMGWALGPVSGAEQLMEYEGQVGRLLAERRATAVCQYDRQGFDNVSLAGVAAAHARTVAAVVYHEDPVLRICRQHVPPGVRLAGELDCTRIEPLRQALAEAVRLDGDVHVNADALRFIDAAAAGEILQAALGMPDGRRMIIACRALTGKVLRALRAEEAPHLRLVVGDVD